MVIISPPSSPTSPSSPLPDYHQRFPVKRRSKSTIKSNEDGQSTSWPLPGSPLEDAMKFRIEARERHSMALPHFDPPPTQPVKSPSSPTSKFSIKRKPPPQLALPEIAPIELEVERAEPGSIDASVKTNSSTALPQFLPPPKPDPDTKRHKEAEEPSSQDEKKPRLMTTVRSLSFASLAALKDEDPSWHPTWFRPLAVVGIGALLCAACCTLASLGILLGSNGQPTKNWTWSPSVFLAIFSAISNRAVQFALVQALPYAWWYRASRGTTLRELHTHWEAGQGLFRALRNIKYEKLLAVAAIACTFVAIDGPLLQKASSVESQTQSKSTTLRFPIAPEMPTGFSGTFDKEGLATSWEMAPAVDAWLQNSTVTANITGCEGTCRAVIHGPGAAITNCSEKRWPLNRQTLTQNKTAQWGSGSDKSSPRTPLFVTEIFDSSVKASLVGPEQVEIWIGVANYTECTGEYVEKTCSVVSAIVEYDVIVQKGNVVDFARPPGQGIVVSLANNSFVNGSKAEIPLTITGLASFLDGQITSNASMEVVSDSRESASALMPDPDSFNSVATKYSIHADPCRMAWMDPTEDILSDFNNIMFRSGIIAATLSNSSGRLDPGLRMGQTVNATQTLTQNVFNSDLRWFAGAAALEVLAILAIIPVFWGYWRVGVGVTFNPLEIANRFQAPLFNEVNSAAGSRGTVQAVGNIKVKFGADEHMDGKATAAGIHDGLRTRLVVGRAANIESPRKNMAFDC